MSVLALSNPQHKNRLLLQNGMKEGVLLSTRFVGFVSPSPDCVVDCVLHASESRRIFRVLFQPSSEIIPNFLCSFTEVVFVMVRTVAWSSNNNSSINLFVYSINVILKGLICSPKLAKTKSSTLSSSSLSHSSFADSTSSSSLDGSFVSSLFNVASIIMAPNGLYFNRLPSYSCQAMFIHKSSSLTRNFSILPLLMRASHRPQEVPILLSQWRRM